MEPFATATPGLMLAQWPLALVPPAGILVRSSAGQGTMAPRYALPEPTSAHWSDGPLSAEQLSAA
ncbi:MAG TPA: hypothetical protein VH684_27360 [Xanthobacteraceae bacterium]